MVPFARVWRGFAHYLPRHCKNCLKTSTKSLQSGVGPYMSPLPLSPLPLTDPDSPIPGAVSKAWSNNSDNRMRYSSLSVGTKVALAHD